jgi:hypothetical protein
MEKTTRYTEGDWLFVQVRKLAERVEGRQEEIIITPAAEETKKRGWFGLW